MRPIVGPCALSGRCAVSGSSSESSPASRSCMIPTAVNVFVIEPIRYCVCGVASRCRLDVRVPERLLPQRLAAAEDRRADRRHPLLRLGGREPVLEVLAEPVRR